MARRHLVAGYDRPRDWKPRIELDDLPKIFSEHDVEVAFR